MMMKKKDIREMDPADPIEVDGMQTTPGEYGEHMDELTAAMALGIVKERDEWIMHRRQLGVEDEWRRAGELYFGKDTPESAMVDTLKNGPRRPQKADQIRSRVVVNIVRPKVDKAVARMCEILLPEDDRNWGIGPTPVPATVSKRIGNQTPTVDANGQETGLTAHEEAQSIIAAAKEAAEGMERQLADWMTEAALNGQERDAVEDLVRLGPAIIEFDLMLQTSKSWARTQSGVEMHVSQKIQPAPRRLDPWCVWFDPSAGNDHPRGKGYWTKRDVTRRELRQLIGTPGYDEESIRAVLEMPPTKLHLADNRVGRKDTADKSYELWRYHGEIEPEHMTLCCYNNGMDPIEDVEFGVLLVVNDKIIGAYPSYVVDQTLPVHVSTWRKSDEHPYGHGLPIELEHQQRVVNAAWRQVMDNARNSGGSQIVARRGVEPQDGNYTIVPNKVWVTDGDGIDDVRKAFEVYDIPSHVSDLLALAQAAMTFAEEETGVAQTMGSAPGGSAPETVGGQILATQQQSADLRQRVKRWDDQITRPLFGQLYDYAMSDPEVDPSIKGDAEVDARGVSSLLQRDIQDQAALNLVTILQNQKYAPYVDPKKELALVLRSMRHSPEDILLPPEVIKQNEANPQPAPPDPRIQAAEMQLQGKQLDIQDRQAQRQVDAQLAQAELQMKQQQLAYNTERERAEAVQSQRDAQLQRELELARIDRDGVVTQQELAQKERMQAIDLDSKHALFNAEMAVKVNQGSGI